MRGASGEPVPLASVDDALPDDADEDECRDQAHGDGVDRRRRRRAASVTTGAGPASGPPSSGRSAASSPSMSSTPTGRPIGAG